MDILEILRTALQQALGPQAIVFALLAIGLNVHFGYTGLLNFGQAGFALVSAYGLAVTIVTFGAPFWLGLIVAMIAPLVLAVILGLPTLRLRADYLAIVTIAAAEILRFVAGAVETKDVFGGSNGLSGFAGPFQAANPYSKGVDLGIVAFRRDDLWSLTVGWALVAVCCVLVWALMRSPWGRVLRSIREDEDAVRSLGKNVFAYKMQALALGGLIGGLGGLFLALKQASVVPTNYATLMTFYAFAALLLGGAARVLGPVIGAILFWFLIAGLGSFFSQSAGADGWIPTVIMTDTQASLIRYIVLGLAIILLMIFRPQGIFGDRREIAIDER